MLSSQHCLATPEQLAGQTTDATAPDGVPAAPARDTVTPPASPDPGLPAAVTEALPPAMRAAVLGIADAIKVAEAMALQCVLGAVGLCAQRLANVRQPLAKFDSVVPLTLFMLTVADSGDRKTATDRVALRVLREEERRLRKEQEEALNAEDEASASETPMARLLMEEGTLDGLLSIISRGQPSMGLFSDEGAQMLSGHAMKPDESRRTTSTFSKFWDGSPVDRLRADPSRCAAIVDKRLAVHLMIQPVVAAPLLSDEVANGQGFLARFLIAWPASLKGTRLLRSEDILALGETPTAEAAEARNGQAEFDAKIRTMIDVANFREDVEEEPGFPVLQCDRPAAECWLAFFNDLELRCGRGGDLAKFGSFVSKLAEHALRLAACLAVFEDPETDRVTEPFMRAGIALASWYLDELAAHTGPAAPEVRSTREDDDANALRAWLGRWKRETQTDGLVSIADIKQRGPAKLRKGERATNAVAILEERNELVPEPGSHEILGRKRDKVWRYVPLDPV